MGSEQHSVGARNWNHSAATSTWRRTWHWPRARSSQITFYDECIFIRDPSFIPHRASVAYVCIASEMRHWSHDEPQNQFRCSGKVVEMIFTGPTPSNYTLIQWFLLAGMLIFFSPLWFFHRQCALYHSLFSICFPFRFLFSVHNATVVWLWFLCRSAIWHEHTFKFIELISIKIAVAILFQSVCGLLETRIHIHCRRRRLYAANQKICPD